jgi:hypothetical protein
VVVVETAEEADAVISTRIKRTGKQVDLTPARRAAEARGVPFLLLPNVSGLRLAGALAPLLGPGAAAAAARAAAAAAGPRSGWQAPAPRVGDDPSGSRGRNPSSGGEGDAPRIIPWEQVSGDGSDALMQLLWGAAGTAAAAPGLGGGGGWEPLAVRAERMADPWAWLAAEDAEDDREDALPPNPTARAAARAPPARRPPRRGAKVRRRKLAKEVSELQAEDW